MFEFDLYDKSYDRFFSSEENGEQIMKKGDTVLSTNFTLEIQNRKVEGLITFSID